MNRKENATVREVSELILIYGLLLQIVLLFFVRERLYVFLGLWLGIAIGIYMAVHIHRMLKASIGADAKTVQRHILKHTVIRYLVVAVIFGITIKARLGSPLAFFAGVMGLKAAAFLQPSYHKIKNKKEVK